MLSEIDPPPPLKRFKFNLSPDPSQDPSSRLNREWNDTSTNQMAGSASPAQSAAIQTHTAGTLAENSRTGVGPPIDFDALAESLLRKRYALPSLLVRFMKDRSTATFQDVIDSVHGGNREDGSIRTLVNRTNNLLSEQKSLLRFSTRACQVIRHIAPE